MQRCHHCYEPSRTKLIYEAESGGAAVIGGGATSEGAVCEGATVFDGELCTNHTCILQHNRCVYNINQWLTDPTFLMSTIKYLH